MDGQNSFRQFQKSLSVECQKVTSSTIASTLYGGSILMVHFHSEGNTLWGPYTVSGWLLEGLRLEEEQTLSQHL